MSSLTLLLTNIICYAIILTNDMKCNHKFVKTGWAERYKGGIKYYVRQRRCNKCGDYKFGPEIKR